MNMHILYIMWSVVSQTQYVLHQIHLNTIGGCWYFDRAFVLQRLKNQSLYNKILLLQKFNDTLGQVLKHFIFSL